MRPRTHLDPIERTPHLVGTRQGRELMDRNERSVDFPLEVMRDLCQRISPFMLRAYPEPEPLYAKLASWLNIPREMLLITAGADGGLKSIFEVFVEPGDEVVTASPSYAMYPLYSQMVGAVREEVRFHEDLSLPLESVLSRISPKTKLVVLANPNQPIERVYSSSEIDRLLKACAQNNTLLVMDEAYHHFCPETALPWVSECENLIIVRTFSKAFGAAGIRLGYLVSNPKNIRHLNKIRPMYETHSFAILVGLYLLENDHLMESYVGEVKQARRHLTLVLRQLGFEVFGQWTNSILVELPRELSAKEIAKALKEKGILIRVETDPLLPNHLRITVGSEDQAERFLRALQDVLSHPRLSLTKA